jgi:hypothetical protein
MATYGKANIFLERLELKKKKKGPIGQPMNQPITEQVWHCIRYNRIKDIITMSLSTHK